MNRVVFRVCYLTSKQLFYNLYIWVVLMGEISFLHLLSD